MKGEKIAQELQLVARNIAHKRFLRAFFRKEFFANFVFVLMELRY
jgi:hypothetical protein